VTHFVRSPDGTEAAAKCRVAVDELIAELNYEPFAAFNTKRDMMLGITRLTFLDADRTAIAKLEWKSKGKSTFQESPFKKPDFRIAPSPPYCPPKKSAKKLARLVRDRAGQSNFSKRLRGIYDNTCCVTGCKVPDVLESAHIDPYSNHSSHNLKNGLLLRSDIHALFDKFLLGIEPLTHTIHVSKAVSSSPEYEGLQNVELRQPNGLSHEPDVEALQRHWEEFQKRCAK
jgi:hypothetical protein